MRTPNDGEWLEANGGPSDALPPLVPETEVKVSRVLPLRAMNTVELDAKWMISVLVASCIL